MTDERGSHDQSSNRVAPLLAALGREEAAVRSADQELARAGRFAAKIDEQLASLTEQRKRSSRAARFALALAAALPLTWFAARASRQPRLDIAIAREPTTSSVTTARPRQEDRPLPEPAPAAATSVVFEPKSATRPRANSSASLDPILPVPAVLASQPSAEPESSTLGAENQLFGEAAGFARAGNVERALAGFERLVHDYPRSPLSQTALVRAFRLLAKQGRQTEAKAHAQRYLEAYPTGFAVSEAQALIRGAAAAGGASDERAP